MFLCVSDLFTYMQLHHAHGWCLWRPKEDIRTPGDGVVCGCVYAVWVLETKLQSSTRAVGALNH